VLLLILAMVLIVGLLDQGKGHSTPPPTHTGTGSVFPKPSTVPTVAAPTTVAPPVSTQAAPATTTAQQPAPAKPVKHPAAHHKAHKSSPPSSPAASTPPPTGTGTGTASVSGSPRSYVPSYTAPRRGAPAAPPSPSVAGGSLSGGSLIAPARHHKKHR
jgi:hypothetical protein